MKIALALLLFGLVAAIIVGCTMIMKHKEVLEYENVAQYKLDLNPKTKIPEKISGLCFRSMYCVSGITTQRQGASLIVLVEIDFCKDGQSGDFSYPLEIPNDVDELRFGRDEHLLWTRNNNQPTRQP
jgi:hypothetical protein